MELEADSSLEVRKRLSLLREHGIGELGWSFRIKIVLSIITHCNILKLNSLYANDYFSLLCYNESGMVHCTFQGVIGRKTCVK